MWTSEFTARWQNLLLQEMYGYTTSKKRDT